MKSKPVWIFTTCPTQTSVDRGKWLYQFNNLRDFANGDTRCTHRDWRAGGQGNQSVLQWFRSGQFQSCFEFEREFRIAL